MGVLSSPLRRDHCENLVDISQMANDAMNFHPRLLRHEAAICWRRGSRASLNFPTTHIWSLMKGLANTLAALFINKCFFWTHSCWNNGTGCVRGVLQNIFMIYQRFHSTVRLFFLISFLSGSLIALSSRIHFHGNKATARWQEAGMFRRAPEQEVSKSLPCERQQGKCWALTICYTRPGVTSISVSDYLFKNSQPPLHGQWHSQLFL